MNLQTCLTLTSLCVAAASAGPVQAQPASAASSAAPASAAGPAGRGVTPPQHPLTDSQRANTDQEFVRKAARANASELAAGRLAAEKARDPAIQRFAQQMVSDHSRVMTELTELARRQGLQVPDMGASPDDRQLARLRGLQGEAFDRLYVQHFGVQAHRQSVDLFQRQATQGRDAALIAFAGRTLPSLQEHLRMAQALPGGAAVLGAAREARRRQDQRQERMEDRRDAQVDVIDAVQVVQRMKANPDLMPMLRQAKGLFILPDYGRGALIVGAQGGEGVLVTRRNDGWSNPVFYKMGGVSVGLQAGGSAGEMALVLMTDRAVERFRSDRKFSLNADAGLSMGNWAQRRQASTGKVQDVVVWSGTKGAYAGASVGVTDVMLDRDANRAYYGREASVPDILSGAVPNPRNNVLDKVLDL